MRGISVQSEQTLLQKFARLNWGLIFLIFAVTGIGIAALYSAGGGNFDPWASRQLVRFAVGCIGMVIIALVDIKWWYKLTWPIYFVGMILLVIVEVMGHVGMGAQRWINLGFIQLQPSEMMRIAVIMALARHYHGAAPQQVRRVTFLFIPCLIIFAPVSLVMMQPDLGTSLMMIMGGVGMIFLAGAPVWLFVTGVTVVAVSIPIAWQFMHEYQKRRVRTFLDPESDPLGAGYHITQSKIAIGSGGIEGKGFLEGTQSNLNFLPEKHTDFIFTLWVEEWGLMGGLALLSLLLMIFAYGFWIAMRSKSNFGRFLAMGLTLNFSLYVFINIGMVMGLLPVVGKALPLVSYGGTSMLAALMAFGLVMAVSVHRHSKVTR